MFGLYNRAKDREPEVAKYAKQSWIHICGSCEHLYLGDRGCPKCGWGYYSAVRVLGYRGLIRELCKQWFTKRKQTCKDSMKNE